MKSSLFSAGVLASLLLSGCGSSDPNFVVTGNGSVPAVTGDSYASLGNATLQIGAGEGLLADVQSGSVVAGTLTTALGGIVTLAADGSFTYSAPVLESGARQDSFSYRLSSGQNGSVAVDLPHNIFYVKAGSAAGGDGTEPLPFATVQQAVNQARTNDVIMCLYSPTVLTYTGPLPVGGQLLGQGVPHIFGNLGLLSVDYTPLQAKIALASGNQLAGLRIEYPLADGGAALRGDNVQDVEIEQNEFSNMHSRAIELTTGSTATISDNVFSSDDQDSDSALFLTDTGEGSFDILYENNNIAREGLGHYRYGVRAEVDNTRLLKLVANDNQTEARESYVVIFDEVETSATNKAPSLDLTIDSCQMAGEQGIRVQAGSETSPSSLISLTNNRISASNEGITMFSYAADDTAEHDWTISDNLIGNAQNGITVDREGPSVLRAILNGNGITASAVGILLNSNQDGVPGFAGEDHYRLTSNSLLNLVSDGSQFGISMNLGAQVQSTLVEENISESPVVLTLDGIVGHLLLSANTISGALDVVIDDPQAHLVKDDTEQTTPVPTYSGPHITNGPFVPQEAI